MSKKTIGILTFHTALNYGAVLQTYALKYECEQLGFNAHIIDYRPDYLKEEIAPVKYFMQSPNKKRAAFKLVRSLMSYPGDKKREKEFKQFRDKYLLETVVCRNVDDIKNLHFDIYIAGSDQIWNYKITGNSFDSVFFLDFESTAKKVVYAASSQDTPFPLDYENRLKSILHHTDAVIGIREEKLADYVAKLTNIKYPVVLDPTLLAGKAFLDTIAYQPLKEEYILLYQIDSNPASDICVKNLEKRFKCKVYTMTVPRLGDTHGRLGDAGPETFLSLLSGAKFLVTNSFHGIAISLLMHKQFYVYENGGVMIRIDNLLDNLGLNGQKVKMVNDIDPHTTIDYYSVDQLLAEKQQQAREFLEKGLLGENMAEDYIPVEPQAIPMKKKQKKDCCGCSSCEEACPVSAIKMSYDREGFLYPRIDRSKCIHCGKCDSVCGFFNRKSAVVPKAVGVKHKNDSIRMNSRSGGAFVAFSDYILDNGGVVYGAAMQDDFSVKHIRATDKTQRNLMQKAKYVQSDTRGVFSKVATDLKEDRYVLFSGTPCQVAGLKTYLKVQKIDDKKLYCCDLVCHGVPSPLLWNKYTKYVEKKNKHKILEANFRDKEFGWDSHCESFVLDGEKKKYVSRDYTDLFYDHIMFRPSCHNCQFSNIHRPGDITLADFWGIEKNNDSFNDNKGVSLVLLSSEKGSTLFNTVKKHLEYFECNIENCMQPTLYKPSSVSARRKEFWDDFNKLPFEKVLKKYTRPLTKLGRVKRSLKKIMYHTGARKHP